MSPAGDGIFAGTAAYYAKYRAPYPAQLVTDIVSHFGLDGRGRLLDLGCGPGTLTFALAPHFERTVAADVDEDMVAEGQRLAPPGAPIEWHVMAAEEISPAMGKFRLVTCGSSFHWMDRDAVLRKVSEMLEPGGGMAFAAGIRPWWDGPEDWHQVLSGVVKRYLGEDRRAGSAVFKATGELFEDTLERNGWHVEVSRDYETAFEWDIDSVIGHLWSTSFAGRTQFGDRVDDFERDLRGELAALGRDVYRETGMSGLVCGRPGPGQWTGERSRR